MGEKIKALMLLLQTTVLSVKSGVTGMGTPEAGGKPESLGCEYLTDIIAFLPHWLVGGASQH